MVLLSTEVLKVVLWTEDESDRNIVTEQQEGNVRKVLALHAFSPQRTAKQSTKEELMFSNISAFSTV